MHKALENPKQMAGPVERPESGNKNVEDVKAPGTLMELASSDAMREEVRLDSSGRANTLLSMSKLSDVPQKTIQAAETVAPMSVPQEAVHSFFYSLAQKPVTGVMQLVDHTVGKPFDSNLAGSTKFMSAPTQAEFMSARWHAQVLGGTAGMIPWFLAATKVSKGSLAGYKNQAQAMQLAGKSSLLYRPATVAIAEGAGAGFLYDSLLTPVSPEEGNFFAARLKHGMTGAATFGTLTASTIGLSALGKVAAEQSLISAEKSIVAQVLESRVANAAISGVPAGFVNAQVASGLFMGRPANLEETGKSVYTMVFAGGALGALHAIPGRAGGAKAEARVESSPESSPESRPGAKPETVTGREALVEKVAGAARLEVVEGQPKAPEKILTPESRALAGVDGPAEPIKFNITGDPAVVEAFQRGANLAIEAVQLNSEAAAGKFQQFAATEGQAMGRTMLEMAHMLNSKALIDVVSEAYKIDKPASLVVRGEALAKLAADPESQQPDRTAMFFDYAKNEGSNRGPELLEYAKQVGDPRLQIVVKEAYLLAQGKQAPRLNEPVSLQLTEEQAGRWIDFMTLVKDLPLEPENYGQFRYNLFTWMNANPDLVPSVIKYASVHPASQIAGPVDYYAPEHSNSLARFPVLESKGAPVVEPVAKSVEESAAETAPQPVEQGKTQGLEKLPEVELVEAPPEARPEPVQKTNVESGAKVESTSKGRRLWESFITSKTPQIKESNARLLTEHFGQMTPLEFKQYLDFVFERPDGPDGAPRLNRLWIPSSRVLQSKPVTEAYEASPEGKGPLEAFQHFLSANKAETPDFPPWLSEYVNMRLMYARSIAPEGAAPHEVLDLALPRNLIRDIRTNFIDITLKPVPQPEVSPKLPQELADIFEAARQSDTRNVQVGRPPREQGNTIADRMDRLTELLEIKDEAIRNRLIELGGKDHPRLKNITGKLDPETSAPEYKELLQIALPGAQRLSEVSTMLDAIFSAGKTRRNSPNSPEVLATEQLAIAALQQMVPGNSPKLARGEQIIHDMITGKIRDPRPGGGGFGGNAGGRPAGGFQGQNQPREHGGGDRGLGKRESGVNKGDRAPVVPVKPAPEAEVVAALKTDPVVKPEVVVEGETSTGAKNAAPLEKDSTVEPEVVVAKPKEKASPPVSELFDFSQPPKTEMERLMRDAFLKKDQGKGKRGKGERTRDRDYDEEGEPGRKRRKGQDDENSNQRNRGGARNNTRHYLDESESDFDG